MERRKLDSAPIDVPLPRGQITVYSGGMNMPEIFRHQNGQRAPKQFSRFVAKNPFKGRVRENDGAVLVNADDGVGRSVRNNAEMGFAKRI